LLSRWFSPRPLAPLTTWLETPRLVLRPPERGDAPALRALTARNAEHLRPWSPAPAPGRDPLAPGELRAQIERQRDEWLQDRTYAFLLERRGTGALLGRMTISQVVRGPMQSANLGYWIDQDHQGDGLTTEAAREALRFAFGPLRLHRIQAGTLPHNEASQRVLARVGFRREGYAERYLQIAGRWQDHVLFAVTTEDLEPPPP
jgi:ribosomal-protein-alanine N-acetyltransferase